MKRIYLPVCSICIFSALAFSQAYEGSIEYNKKKQQAILIDYG